MNSYDDTMILYCSGNFFTFEVFIRPWDLNTVASLLARNAKIRIY